MIVPIILDAKPLRRYLNTQLNYTAIRIAINLFLNYVLQLDRTRGLHEKEKLMQAAEHFYTVHHDVLMKLYTTGWCEENKAKVQEGMLEAILELVEVLEQHYLYEIRGVLSELGNNYWVEEINFHRITRNCIHVLARCRHVLPATLPP